MTHDELIIRMDIMMNYCSFNLEDDTALKHEKHSIILHDLMQREIIRRKDDQLNAYEKNNGIDYHALCMKASSMMIRIKRLESTITHLISACEDKCEEKSSMIMVNHMEAVVNHAKDVLHSDDHGIY